MAGADSRGGSSNRWIFGVTSAGGGGDDGTRKSYREIPARHFRAVDGAVVDKSCVRALAFGDLP